MLDFIFGNSVVSKVQRKKKKEGQVEVLKKEQKVKSEGVIQEYEAKKVDLVNQIDAQIRSFEAQIASLKNSKKTRCGLLDQEKKVALDRVINEYDMKIITKQNQIKRLTRFITAEQKNMEDVINPSSPNAPTQRTILNEDIK